MIEPNRVGLLLSNAKRIFSWIWTKVKKIKNWLRSNWRDWLTPAVILLTGVFTGGFVTSKIASNEQKLFALQIFSDRLTGNRIERDLTLELIKILDDPILTENLTDISNRTAIKLNADSIWGATVNGRENVIQEYAELYKKYPEEVMRALKKQMPDLAGMQQWAPVISISKFFYYLTEYGDGKWKGTKEDSIMFATLRKSKYYLYPVKPDSSNVPLFLEIGLKNFSEIKN